MTTPRIRNGSPSRRLPLNSHSDQTSSPDTTLLMTSVRRSGTEAKICSQFRRTCSAPPKLRAGWIGHTL